VFDRSSRRPSGTAEAVGTNKNILTQGRHRTCYVSGRSRDVFKQKKGPPSKKKLLVTWGNKRRKKNRKSTIDEDKSVKDSTRPRLFFHRNASRAGRLEHKTGVGQRTLCGVVAAKWRYDNRLVPGQKSERWDRGGVGANRRVGGETNTNLKFKSRVAGGTSMLCSIMGEKCENMGMTISSRCSLWLL